MESTTTNSTVIGLHSVEGGKQVFPSAHLNLLRPLDRIMNNPPPRYLRPPTRCQSHQDLVGRSLLPR